MLPAPEQKLTPVDSKFGKALIAYFSSTSNPYTSYLKASCTILRSEPRKKLEIKNGQSIGILNLLYARKLYETTAVIDCSYSLVFYGIDPAFLINLREQAVAALDKRKSSDLNMPDQRVDSLRVANQRGVRSDKAIGLEYIELAFLVRLTVA